MEIYHKNLNNETLNNNCYRKIVYTGKMQIILQSLKPEDTVDLEKHKNIDQFIRCEHGKGIVKINNIDYKLKSDDAIVVPAGFEHSISNYSKTKTFKFYTIYSKPEHTEDENLC